MMEISTLITFLQTSVNGNVGLAGGLKIYVFGSAIRSCSPRDVDLVVVYNPSSVEVDDVLAYRRCLQRDCYAEFGLPLDVCLLTEQEAQNNPFLAEEGAVLVYG
jgi:hypothetical protein